MTAALNEIPYPIGQPEAELVKGQYLTAMGIVFAQVISNAFGWQFCELRRETSRRQDAVVAVVSPDQSHFVYPIGVVYREAHWHGDECRKVYERIKAGNLPAVPPGSFFEIVPDEEVSPHAHNQKVQKLRFEYLDNDDVESLQEIAFLGLGMLAKMKFGDSGAEYHPRMDDLVRDIETFLNAESEEPDRDPDDPIMPNVMGKLYGFAFVWAYGYRWAKNPSGIDQAGDVVVSSNEHRYLNPLDMIFQFMSGEGPSLKEVCLGHR